MKPEIVSLGVSHGTEARMNFDGTDLWLEYRRGDEGWQKAARRVDRVWVPMGKVTNVVWSPDKPKSSPWN
jgi:hypothetical protein